MTLLCTKRLFLRQWRKEDKEKLAKLHADEEVMRYFPYRLTEEESDRWVESCREHIAQHQFGIWAVERMHTGEFIGCIGLNATTEKMPFPLSMELLWRFDLRFMTKDFAMEAALEVLDYAFSELSLPRVIAYVSTHNSSSIALMRSIGMRDCQQNFLHPALPADHELAEHVLYEIRAPH